MLIKQQIHKQNLKSIFRRVGTSTTLPGSACSVSTVGIGGTAWPAGVAATN
ncbi:hypothetical protein ACVCAH_02985 [Micromonospora sp. LZ34]